MDNLKRLIDENWEKSKFISLSLNKSNVYNTNSFELIGINKPSYYYVDKNFLRRVNRMKFQKKHIGAYDCTEYEKAREMGYEKIWDCGTLAFGYGQ